jgi:regulatory protein
LCRKLAARGFSETGVAAELDRLAAQGLQSDQRFGETYVVQRAARGYGPRRIVLEMRERGIPDDMIDAVMQSNDSNWCTLARRARTKRFGLPPPAVYKDRARQMHFLQYRGFTPDQIDAAVATDVTDPDTPA